MLAISNWKVMREQAEALVMSGLLPREIKKAEQAIAIMIKGHELGIQAMHALSHIHIINGKPTMSAELMLAMIMRHCPTAKINYEQNDDKACRLVASRANIEKSSFSFSIEDARRAGLLSNPTWTKYPRAMLRSRAVSEMARSMFPDCISGISYTPEEVGGDAVSVDENGYYDLIAEAEPKTDIRPKAKAPIELKPAAEARQNVMEDRPAHWQMLEEALEKDQVPEEKRAVIRKVAVGKTSQQIAEFCAQF